MTPEMEDRYQTLADFMEWVDPDGFADVRGAEQHTTQEADK